jgi:adenylyltransferase/sulfurtransferase
VEPPSLERYVRQIRYAPIGESGQRRLLASRALICGCGALGTVIANTLARAGVGNLRIVDRDFIELNNLQRQVLFDEDDIEAELPKAVAAANKLRRINRQINVEPVVADVDHTNVVALCDGVGVILDGTDNFETRFLLNDVSLRLGIPWIYGGCVGASGQTMTIVPGRTACLRCLHPEPPPAGSTETCDTAGILAPVVNVVASWQAMQAIKIFTGSIEAVEHSLTMVDMWDNRLRQIRLDSLRDQGDCPACRRGEFPWLAGERGSHSVALCGRNAVQLIPPGRHRLSLEGLAAKLRGIGEVRFNEHLLRLAVDDHVLTVFPDGRAIVSGTDNVSVAKTLYARYIGA